MPEPIAASPSAGWGALVTLFGVVVASVWLGTLASRAVSGGFLRSYFLGNRGLGAWALAQRSARSRSSAVTVSISQSNSNSAEIGACGESAGSDMVSSGRSLFIRADRR